MNTIGLINEIGNILYEKLPNFHIEVDVRKWRLGGGEYIKIGISASTYEINGVAKQYPQYVTLMLDLKTLKLEPFPFGGMGGGSIHLVPNSAEPSERYLAIKSIKVPFRKPQPNEKAVLSAIERFAENYLKLLQQYRDRLTQQAFVDYDKLLGPKMKKGGVMSKTKDKKTMKKGGVMSKTKDKKTMAKGGNTDVLLIAYGDSDYDNKIGHFTSKKMAKHFAKQNVDKYGSIMFEDFYGDTIVVNKGDTNEDIDWLFSDNMAKGGLLGGFNYSIGGL